MPIATSDVVFLLSAPTASSGYSAPGVVGSSLGKYASTSVLSATSLDNLFTDITGPENAGLQVDYACLFVLNNTATGLSMQNAVVWIPTSTLTAGGATLKFATDNIGVTAKGSALAQAAVIGSSVTAPTGVSAWTSPSASNSGGLSVGTVAPGYVFAVWIQRTATNSGPVASQSMNIQVDFGSSG